MNYLNTVLLVVMLLALTRLIVVSNASAEGAKVKISRGKRVEKPNTNKR